MADDAAGAVRRTPRPAAKPPTAWWSPTEGFWSTNDGPVEGLRVLDFADEFRAYPPPDAVELVGPDQRRPVVLLRADDCACRYGDDCPHGPEPVDALDLAVWLRAEQQWLLGSLLALTIRHRDSLARRCAVRFENEQRLLARVAVQEQVLQIVNEQTNDCVEQVDAALGHRYHTPGVHYSVPHVAEKAAAELKQLETARAAALAIVADVLSSMDLGDGAAGADGLERVRAVLQGDQPTEPPSEEDVRSLRLHLASVHKLANAFALPATELDDVHQYDHFGPCGLRNHDVADRSYDEAQARAVVAEADDEPTGEADRG